MLKLKTGYRQYILIRNITISKILFLSLFLLSFFSNAQLATNIAMDVKAMSLGNAVTAAPPGVSAIHFNPAGLAKIKGKQFDLQAFAVDFDIQTEFSAPVGYGFFGFNNDPVVCAEFGEDDSCDTFQVRKSETDGVSIPIPLRDDLFDVPQIPFSAAAALPGYAVRPVDSKITFANGISAPLMVGYNRKDGDAGNFMGQKVGLARLNYLTPSMAFQINDEWSLGATINFAFMGFGLESDFRSPNELTALLKVLHNNICEGFVDDQNIVTDIFLFGLCRTRQAFGPFDSLASLNLVLKDSLSPNFHVGVLWEPTRNFSWGAVFHSPGKAKLSGKYKLDYDPLFLQTINGVGQSPTGSIALQILGIPTTIPNSESGIATLDLDFPAHFQTGVRWKILNQFQFLIDLGWTNYSEWDFLNIEFDRSVSVFQAVRLLSNLASPNAIQFPLGLQDVWSLGFGTEWYYNDRLTLRMGYEPRRSAIPLDRRTPMIPITNTDLLGFGMSYRWDKYTEIDTSIAFIKSKDAIPADTSKNSNSGNIADIIYNPYADLNIKTEANILYLGIAFRTQW